MQDKQLIFLISQPRSGSTLTQRIIGAHPQVYTRSEPWVMLHSLYSMKQQNLQAEFDVNLWKQAFNDFIDNLPENSREFYVHALRDMHLNLYGNYLSHFGKQYFLDKTPRYYFVIDELYEVFPDAKYILLLRHPLAVLYSILKTWVHGDLSKLVMYRHDLIAALESAVQLLDSDRENKCVIRYEEMLESPSATVQRFCRYIGMDFSENMVSDYFSVDASDWIFGDPVHAKLKNKIDKSSEEKWHEGLTSSQTWRFYYDYLQFIGKANFEKLGYDYDATMSLLFENIPATNINVTLNTTFSLLDCIHPESDPIYDRFQFSKKYSLIFSHIQKLKNSECKYALYGNGTFGQTIQAIMADKIVGFVDREDEDNLPVNLKMMEFDKIIITVLGREKEIKQYLICDLEIPDNKIITLGL